MTRPARQRIAAAITAVVTVLVASTTARAVAAAQVMASADHHSGVQAACRPARPGWAQCLALYRIPVHADLAAQPAGYGPSALRSAYSYPTTGGAGQTVALIDAYDDPNAETDLAAYRAQYGLPECTTANGCFRKVDQDGAAGPLPSTNSAWATEISLDLDMVSAACSSCHILLVEAGTPSLGDLAAGVDTAVRLGATEVSNSYGAAEDTVSGVASYRSHYRHPGVPILASSGDAGFGAASLPAAYPSVIAVGGTTLTTAATARGWSETAWSEASSGCSAWVAKPAWQHDAHCHMRTVSDVSADADPATGVAVYDSFEQPGWLVVGGTSASAPFIAAGIALAGNGATINNANRMYRHRAAFHDVVGGTTSGADCGGDYLCTATVGYDGPTGLGSPDGVGGL